MAYNTGATFYPGGDDSYYMPEVVSPAPQRLNEHPVNIEQNVANMEQQAASRNGPRLSIPAGTGQQMNQNAWSPVSPAQNPYPQNSYASHTFPPNTQAQNSYEQNPYVQHSISIPQQRPYQHTNYGEVNLQPIPEQPNFSSFPRVPNRGPTVPPTPEEQEAQLEAARLPVLSSDDVEMQLTWAQDALAYCEISIQNEQRICQTQPARPRTPRVEHMLREDAMKIVEFLADQHQPKAEFIRGMWLEFGKFGYRVDKREAFNCYTRASEKGYARAYYRIGMQFENSNDALKAIKYYQIGANHGDAASSYRLGMMTLLGQHGQMQDFSRGVQLIRTAAAEADDNAPQGAYVLGMLLAGELAQVSVPEMYLNRDLLEAKANIEKAAFMGFAKAQVRMGSAYELGDLGCAFDAALALHYNSLAARQGEADAEMAISKWFLCGQEGVFAKNEEMAFTYAQRAAVSGLATAQFAVGYFYEVGIYVPTDLKQAREWYQKSAESGNEEASKRINAISRSKTISRKDHESVALQKIRLQHAAASGLPLGRVALQRIHQQHADASALPSVQETAPQPVQSPTIEMPDPSRLSLSAQSQLQQPPQQQQQRPASVAPYPTEGPGMLPNPNFRPTSAFGINPALHQRPQQQQQQQQSVHGPGPRHDSYYGGPPQPPPPPHASYPSVYGASGRPQGQPIPKYRDSYGHTPKPMSPVVTSPHLENQPFPNQKPYNAQSPNAPTPPLKANIGFSAPPDPKGADRRNEQRRRPLPSQQGQPQQDRPPPKNGGPSRPPDMNSSRPPRTDSVQPARLEPSRPPRTDSVTPKPTQQKPAKVSASAAATKPPGKGPKTFEEMGVPQAQKESDCIVM